MPRENVEIVRNLWNAFERGDVAAAIDGVTEDIEFDVSRDVWGAVVGGGLYRGRDGLAAWLSDLYAAWETFEMTAEEVFDAGGGCVISVLHARGRGRTSGIEVEHRPAGVATLRDGRVARIEWHASREEALAAATSAG